MTLEIACPEVYFRMFSNVNLGHSGFIAWCARTLDRATYESMTLIPYGTIRRDASYDEVFASTRKALTDVVQFTREWLARHEACFDDNTTSGEPFWPWNYYRKRNICGQNGLHFRSFMRDYYAHNVRRSNALDELSLLIVSEYVKP